MSNGPEFFQTVMGQRFFTSDVPRITDALEKIAEKLDADNKNKPVFSDDQLDMKIYIFKTFCDEDAYGEEVIEAYAKKEDALKRLKEAVERAYDLAWEEIPNEIGLDANDTFEEDYVSIYNGDGATSFWIVEELEVA